MQAGKAIVKEEVHKTKLSILVENNWESRNAEIPRLQCVDRPMRREIMNEKGEEILDSLIIEWNRAYTQFWFNPIQLNV